MEAYSNCKHEHNRRSGAHRRIRGPSSFHMHDPEIVFDDLALKPGDVFLDLGCGPRSATSAGGWI